MAETASKAMLNDSQLGHDTHLRLALAEATSGSWLASLHGPSNDLLDDSHGVLRTAVQAPCRSEVVLSVRGLDMRLLKLADAEAKDD